jgi:flagellar hook-length control protein FliK
MKTLIEQLKTMENQEEPTVSPEKLTESVNQTNELAAQQNAEPEAKITITVERDGVITEVTAKADDSGNVKATTDVAEISTETKVAVETAEPPKQNGSESQNGQRSTEGYEAILNNLLQNRVSAVEARFEPIILETPDTQQIMNQILDFMKVKLTPEVNSLEMQLHPASLGTVSVKITSTAGVVAAQFTAQNETVRAAIEGQLVELKENMRVQGIRVDTIEVNVKSQEFNSQLWQGKDESGENEQGSRKNRRRINLNGLDEIPEELTGDEKLAAEMMIENGQTVDFSA